MRLTLVGAHHPPGHFSEMQRIDVVLDVPLRALFAPRTAVGGRVIAEALARETPCAGTVGRSGLAVFLALAFAADDGAEVALSVRSRGGVSARSLTELRGELRSGGEPRTVRAVVLRLDVLGGAVAGSTPSRHKNS